jgi:hypothetical protein
MWQNWALIGDLPAGSIFYENNVAVSPSNNNKETLTIKPLFFTVISTKGKNLQ